MASLPGDTSTENIPRSEINGTVLSVIFNALRRSSLSLEITIASVRERRGRDIKLGGSNTGRT
jgi:hypothetical protein